MNFRTRGRRNLPGGPQTEGSTAPAHARGEDKVALRAWHGTHQQQRQQDTSTRGSTAPLEQREQETTTKAHIIALCSVHHYGSRKSLIVNRISPGEGERSRFLAAILPACAAGPTFRYPLAAERNPGPLAANFSSPFLEKSRTYNPTRTIQLPYVTSGFRSDHGSERLDHGPLERAAVGSGVSHNPRHVSQCDHLAGAAEGDRIREETAEGRCVEKHPAAATLPFSRPKHTTNTKQQKQYKENHSFLFQDLSGVGEGFAREQQQQAEPGQVTSYRPIPSPLCLLLRVGPRPRPGARRGRRGATAVRREGRRCLASAACSC